MDAKSEKLKNIIKQKYKSIRAFSEIVEFQTRQLLRHLTMVLVAWQLKKLFLFVIS